MLGEAREPVRALPGQRRDPEQPAPAPGLGDLRRRPLGGAAQHGHAVGAGGGPARPARAPHERVDSVGADQQVCAGAQRTDVLDPPPDGADLRGQRLLQQADERGARDQQGTAGGDLGEHPPVGGAQGAALRGGGELTHRLEHPDPVQHLLRRAEQSERGPDGGDREALVEQLDVVAVAGEEDRGGEPGDAGAEDREVQRAGGRGWGRSVHRTVLAGCPAGSAARPSRRGGADAERRPVSASVGGASGGSHGESAPSPGGAIPSSAPDDSLSEGREASAGRRGGGITLGGDE